MSLKYNCPLCGFEIISDFLTAGDLYRCPSCGNKIFVPDNAVNTDQIPNLPKESIKPSKDEESVVAGLDHIDEYDSGEKSELKKERPKEWGVWSVVKFCLVYLFSLIMILLFVSPITAKLITMLLFPANIVGELKHEMIFIYIRQLIMGFLTYLTPLLLIYYSVVIRHNNRFLEALNIYKLTKSEFLKWTVISTAVALAAIGSLILVKISPFSRYLPEEIFLGNYFKAGYLSVIIITAWILFVPFIEEIVFRGYVYKGLEYGIGPVWSGVIVTVCFTGLHIGQISQGLITASVIFIIAVFLIVVRIKTGSLTKCILIHQIYNTMIAIVSWTWFLFID